MIARFWPVDAVVGENGAFWMWHDDKARKLRTRFVQSEAERAEGRRRLEAVRAQVLRDVPGAGIASDQPYRAGRPRHRLLRGRARRCRMPTSLRIVQIFERARRARQGELDPRQRLVRRLRQAHDQPADDGASCSASISRRDATAMSSPAIRPTTRRCSASFPTPWAWPTCATSPADMDHLPRWITHGALRRGLRRAGAGADRGAPADEASPAAGGRHLRHGRPAVRHRNGSTARRS